MPRRKRLPNDSVSVCQPAFIVAALRAYIEAIPVAIVIFFVASSNTPQDANGSRRTASGTQMQRKPSSSSSITASLALDIGCKSSADVQMPTRPNPNSEGFSISANHNRKLCYTSVCETPVYEKSSAAKTSDADHRFVFRLFVQ